MSRGLFRLQLEAATTAAGNVDLDELARLVEASYDDAERNRVQTERSIAVMLDELKAVNEAQIKHMARHDPMTGLPNRVLLREELERMLARGPIDPIALFSIDVDDFKATTESLGPHGGDRLLAAIAARLLECTGPIDIVARLGSDEFAIVQLGTASQPAAAHALGQRIVDAFAAPFLIDGIDFVVSLSTGIAIHPNDASGYDALAKSADFALARAKAEARGAFRFFEPAVDATLKERRAMEHDLRRALAAEEFELHYQPVVDLRKNVICGFEALLRWNHPTRGLISPADFIPLTEETGLIVPLGEWVIRQACFEAARWPASLWVAVNISPIQFLGKSNLFETVMGAINDAPIVAGRLMLEITETVLMQDSEATLAMLHKFRSYGVRICMDDFGTGYSSLGYLRRFPFDKIKIDRSFIRDFPYQRDSLSIVRAAIGLGASLGMSTTAEGVERPEQVENLRAHGCNEVQGFYYSKPRPANDVPDILAKFDADRRSVA